MFFKFKYVRSLLYNFVIHCVLYHKSKLCIFLITSCNDVVNWIQFNSTYWRIVDGPLHKMWHGAVITKSPLQIVLAARRGRFENHYGEPWGLIYIQQWTSIGWWWWFPTNFIGRRRSILGINISSNLKKKLNIIIMNPQYSPRSGIWRLDKWLLLYNDKCGPAPKNTASKSEWELPNIRYFHLTPYWKGAFRFSIILILKTS